MLVVRVRVAVSATKAVNDGGFVFSSQRGGSLCRGLRHRVKG
jgi:hypothetical protein